MSDLDHHVIKGRGKNRGMYLCHAWQAGLPSGEFVWLPEQRKAARWSDPQYGGRYTHQADVANKYDGYFVRLIAPKSIDVDALREFIAQHANGAVERLPCHWFGADFHDPGEDFCRECAEKLVDEKYKANPKAFKKLFGECESAEERYGEAIDGGWCIEHGSPPYCETCGTPLEGSLTEYGMSEEIEALTGEYAPSFRDANSWATLSDAVGNLPDDHPLWRKIARLVEAAKKEEAEAQAAAARLAASRADAAEMARDEARVALIQLLALWGWRADNGGFVSVNDLGQLALDCSIADDFTYRDLLREVKRLRAEVQIKPLGYLINARASAGAARVEAEEAEERARVALKHAHGRDRIAKAREALVAAEQRRTQAIETYEAAHRAEQAASR